MKTINRSALVVKPAQPFLDWLHRVDPTSTHLTLDDLRLEPTIYLLPEWDTEDEALQPLARSATRSSRWDAMNCFHVVVRLRFGAGETGFSHANLTPRLSTSGEIRGRPGYERCFDPSNFFATSLRHQSRIGSGFASCATLDRLLRPSRLPISASVLRSALDKRSLPGRCALRIRFSAARYST